MGSGVRKGIARGDAFLRHVEANIAEGDHGNAATLLNDDRRTIPRVLMVWPLALRGRWFDVLDSLVASLADDGQHRGAAAQAAAYLAGELSAPTVSLSPDHRQRLRAAKAELWRFVESGQNLPPVPTIGEVIDAIEVLYRARLYKTATAAIEAARRLQVDGEPLSPYQAEGRRLSTLADRIQMSAELPKPDGLRDWLIELASGNLWKWFRPGTAEPIPATGSNVVSFRRRQPGPRTA